MVYATLPDQAFESGGDGWGVESAGPKHNAADVIAKRSNRDVIDDLPLWICDKTQVRRGALRSLTPAQ